MRKSDKNYEHSGLLTLFPEKKIGPCHENWTAADMYVPGLSHLSPAVLSAHAAGPGFQRNRVNLPASIFQRGVR